MATIEELIKQYETDPELKAEVEKILEDQKITIGEFMGFVKKHNVEISLSDFPKVIQEAKDAGLIK
jgi:predicted transcriptional regulator